MPLVLDGETVALRDTAQKLLDDANSLRQLRRWRDGGDLNGAARGVWDQFVELGFAGILIPEAFGGSALSSMASIQISEMMGRTLSTAPFVSSAVMGATALANGDNQKLKAHMLALIASGTIVAMAVDERPRHAPLAVATIAKREQDRYRINGRKIGVIDGNIAEYFIITARDAERPDNLLLLLVDAKSAGLTCDAEPGVDSLPNVNVTLNDVEADDSILICAPEESIGLLEHTLDAGRLHLAAELLGIAQEAFDRTVEYLKTRVQFGKRIGEFQALQHRAALLFGQIEIARSLLLKAASEHNAALVSLAKAEIGETAKHVTTEAVQLHGGIGVTDEFDIGFFLKRARVASERLGDPTFHAERYARLQGL